ncbi:16S rRNA (guanine(527)-N(7))-methyltransferase RsmG [Silicimonas algicola]|uniref:Ribosomal RNA small subunit methyltransferase G n=1 Tax=Silicimonas algicola TaxID=1826607 RepID=A0A316G6H6_9RHOB|nr:16S rRNA (guanine(527)-N(7))-methyltransferase RsmG [Silicimonas algicola]AZQ69447.1 16S rRNA (guanine(527)-N(7))-methyltransferase RsmG [Silicimonas algicola]PWK56514.1 16S rRNA (guanine527-N7)-methyltransferase [Silicimonas algicola]
MRAEDYDWSDNVSRETYLRLSIYENLLQKWTARINLVGSGTLADVWQRHFVDSAQLWKLGPDGGKVWADLGSGGGFPGAVIAIIAAEACPEMRVTLIESDQRKAAFLRAVARETGVAFNVAAHRIEEIDPLNADIISARALGSLDKLLEYAKRHMAPGGTALFMKGAKADDEIATALDRWKFRCEKTVSATDPAAVILKIGDIERV